MAYALFENDAKLSRALPTEMDVWRYAEDSGLVIAGAPCPPDTEETASSGIDLLGINKLT